jgi:hypothetical protein
LFQIIFFCKQFPFLNTQTSVEKLLIICCKRKKIKKMIKLTSQFNNNFSGDTGDEQNLATVGDWRATANV